MKAHKEKLGVIVFTAHHKVRGEVHLYENSRLTDILNGDTGTKDFLPVTNATITDLRSGNSQEVGFLSINRRHVELVMEDDETIALTRARDLMSKRRYQDALQFADRAVKVAPNDAEAHFILGFCLAKINRNADAKASFDRCLKLKPNLETAQKAEEMLRTIVA